MKNIKELISGNPYVGRGIIVGKSADGKSAYAYFIMGRSVNSRNRIFVRKGNDVYTEPYDIGKVSDPSLIIYRAVADKGSVKIVTNGDQTDTVSTYLDEGKTFRDALNTREFEPDAPNFTPRISAMIDGDKECVSILKKKGDGCERLYYDYCLKAGEGRLIHTYVTDGNPLPSFEGAPKEVAIPANIDEFAADIWEALDSENKISLYVAYEGKDGIEYRLINKNA